MMFINTENSKTNESHKFVFNLLHRLELGSLSKHDVIDKLNKLILT